jgi:hypothetical protein
MRTGRVVDVEVQGGEAFPGLAEPQRPNPKITRIW